MKRKGLAFLVVAAVAALSIVLLPASGASANHKAAAHAAGKSKTYKSGVYDDYYSPTSLKIHTGDKVKWKWIDTSNSHNVTLNKGPKGVKKKDFTSTTGSFGITFKKTFKKKGTYQFYCTIHPTVMQEIVKVKG